jgi:hypothetical protein
MATPPIRAPTIVAARPKVLLTMPTSSAPKPAPRIRKAVDSAPAKASPSL